jgi:hypothetical protein
LKYISLYSSFVLGLETGSVKRGSRFSKVIIPASYNFRNKISADLTIEDYGFISNNSISVTCLHYSIYLPQYFIAGFSDGSMSIYCEGNSEPIYRLTHYTFKSIRSVIWSPYVPSQFYVLDRGGDLFLFDLLKSGEDKLVVSQNVSIVMRSTTSEITLRPTTKLTFSQFDIHLRLLRLLHGADSDTIDKKSKVASILAVGYNNGRFDVHTLNSGKVFDQVEITTEVNKVKKCIETLHALNSE